MKNKTLIEINTFYSFDKNRYLYFNNENFHDNDKAILTSLNILKLYLVWHTSFASTVTISRDATFRTYFQIYIFFLIKNTIFFICMNNMHMKFCLI